MLSPPHHRWRLLGFYSTTPEFSHHIMSIGVETARKFINCFSTLDGEQMTRLKTPLCQHHFAPESLGVASPRGVEEFSSHLSSLRDVIQGFPVHIKELWESEKSVTIWATSETNFHEAAMDHSLSSEDWIFKGEYIFILELSDDGSQVSRVVEFLDSKKTEELRVLFKRARKNLGLGEKHI